LGASSPSPWDSVVSGGAHKADPDVMDTSDSFSDVSEQCQAHSDFTINSDFTLPPPVATGNQTQNIFTLNNPNINYEAHPRISGKRLFILNVSIANFVDQESLVTKTAAIRCLENSSAHRHHQTQTQLIGGLSRARRGSK